MLKNNYKIMMLYTVKNNNIFLQRMSALVLLLVISFSAHATEWTEQDMVSMDHYTASIDWYNKYNSTYDQEINAKYLLKALEESNAIEDVFLDKVHPSLKWHFRNEYEGGILLLSIGHLGGEKAAAFFMAMPIIDRWKQWYSKHHKEFKYPYTKDQTFPWWILVFIAIFSIGAFVLVPFIHSINKSRRLQKLNMRFAHDARGAGGDVLYQIQMFGIEGIRNISNNFDDKLNELFALAKKDKTVNKVLKKYQIDREKFDDLYGLLIKGRGQAYINGHWVPASSLVYAQTLEFLIKNKDSDDIRGIVHRLVDYFENDEYGEIS